MAAPGSDMTRDDIQRIVRDVLNGRGVGATVVSAEPLDGQWAVTIRDQAARIISFIVPDGPPARVRAVTENWADQT